MEVTAVGEPSDSIIGGDRLHTSSDGFGKALGPVRSQPFDNVLDLLADTFGAVRKSLGRHNL